MSPNEFHTRLAEQMIDNTFDVIWTPETASLARASRIGPYLTPTSQTRKRSDGTVTNAFMQGKC